MNKEEVIAYSVMALKILQNSANGDYKLRDIKLLDFQEEIKIMFKLYKKDEIIEIINRTK